MTLAPSTTLGHRRAAGSRSAVAVPTRSGSRIPLVGVRAAVGGHQENPCKSTLRGCGVPLRPVGGTQPEESGRMSTKTAAQAAELAADRANEIERITGLRREFAE